MYRQQIDKTELRLMFKKRDFAKTKKSLSRQESVLKRAERIVEKGFVSDLSVSQNEKKGKIFFKLKKLEEKIVIRKITRNLFRIIVKKRSNRDFIISNLIRLLEETVAYRLYKLDIKDFYGSVSQENVIQKITSNWRISRPTIRLTKQALKAIPSFNDGLPRGIQLSAALAEVCLEEFDERTREMEHVFFYARFVDDIVILTSGQENQKDFLQKLEESLGRIPNLKLNKKKEEIFTARTILEETKNWKTPEGNFSFLGYNFTVFKSSSHPKQKPRKVVVDIASKKICKIKTRIIKSLISYKKSNNFNLLKQRIKYLTGNFYILDFDTNIKRTAGIFYSHRHANINPMDSRYAPAELDRFFQNILFNKNAHLYKVIGTSLSEHQKRTLLKNSFKLGFKNKVFHYFPNKTLFRIRECWRNG